MVLRVKNVNATLRGLDVWVKRKEEMYVAEYRALIWKIFLRLLRSTPQYTGHAVASWNIGVGAPDMAPTTYVSDVEEPETYSRAERKAAKAAGVDLPSYRPPENVRQRGDRRAIEAAKRRNANKVAMIQRGTKVYFTNTAEGDMGGAADKGQTTTFYLEALQDKSYWAAKLRDVNKPYETVNETIIEMNDKLLRRQGMSFNVGGETWETYL